MVLPSILPSVYRGLMDASDDVRSVAATALLSVSDRLVTLLPLQVRGRDFCLVMSQTILAFFRFLVITIIFISVF